MRFSKNVFLLLLITLLICSASAAQAARKRADFPPVLMYHDVRETALNYFDVTTEDFAAQLDRLKAEGYKTLSMEEFVAIVKEGGKFPEKSVLITFDDGYRGVYERALPELAKRGMKATFFIITDSLGCNTGEYPYITKEELKKMAASPWVSIGSHTRTHAHLEQIDSNQQREEIRSSRELLEKWTGRKIEALAFPYGGYDKSVIEAVRAAGYDVSFAVQDRGLLHEEAKYSIPRIYVGLELGKNHLDTFANYVARYKKMPAELFVERWEFLKN